MYPMGKNTESEGTFSENLTERVFNQINVFPTGIQVGWVVFLLFRFPNGL